MNSGCTKLYTLPSSPSNSTVGFSADSSPNASTYLRRVAAMDRRVLRLGFLFSAMGQTFLWVCSGVLKKDAGRVGTPRPAGRRPHKRAAQDPEASSRHPGPSTHDRTDVPASASRCARTVTSQFRASSRLATASPTSDTVPRGNRRTKYLASPVALDLSSAMNRNRRSQVLRAPVPAGDEIGRAHV